MSKLLPLLFLSAFTACFSDALSPGTQTVKIRAGETMTAGGLVATFRTLESDTRCPMGALCTSGHVDNAVILLRVTPFAGGPDTTGDLNLDVAPTLWSFAGRSIEFIALDPVPRVGETIAQGDYRATLRVTWPAP